ncbi:MAG TPA: 16S rRNA (cytosine(1402)-N(4))-methyltransferase [Acidobacteria bacterium]|nr:16S rRNA (cytosine(1402)-N(4))-methyltransferase [Acidobacteriota bacterium]
MSSRTHRHRPPTMSVAAHLRIRVAEYDRTIRTFIPHYSEMLRVACDALRPRRPAPTIVDLGVGTGALAAACLKAVPAAQLVGLDTDPAMLAVAARRLRHRGRRVELRRQDFTRGALPRADLFTACISLHHVLTPAPKIRLYRRCHDALRRGGALVSIDCMPPAEPGLQAISTEAWLDHMTRTYSRRTARGHLAAWAEEDRYFPLAQEQEMLRAAGFRVEVVWRRGAFAVVRAAKRRTA